MELKSWILLLGANSVEDYTFRRLISCLVLWKTHRLRKQKSVFPLAQQFSPPDFPQRYELYHHEKYSLFQLEPTPSCSLKRWFSPLDASLELNIITNLLIMFLIFRQSFLAEVSYWLIVLKTSHGICRNWQFQPVRNHPCVSNKEQIDCFQIQI